MVLFKLTIFLFVSMLFGVVSSYLWPSFKKSVVSNVISIFVGVLGSMVGIVLLQVVFVHVMKIGAGRTEFLSQLLLSIIVPIAYFKFHKGRLNTAAEIIERRKELRIGVSFAFAVIVTLIWLALFGLGGNTQGVGFVFVIIVLPISILINLVGIALSLKSMKETTSKNLQILNKIAFFLNVAPYGLFLILNFLSLILSILRIFSKASRNLFVL